MRMGKIQEASGAQSWGSKPNLGRGSNQDVFLEEVSLRRGLKNKEELGRESGVERGFQATVQLGQRLTVKMM